MTTLTLAACATRPAPYRFESGLIAGVSAEVELRRRDREPERGGERQRQRQRGGDRDRDRDREAGRDRGPAAVAMDPLPPEEPITSTPSGVVISRLAGPHRATDSGPAKVDNADVATLRGMTGRRITDDPMAFAIAVAAGLSRSTQVPESVPRDGEVLAAWAAEHAISIDASTARTGDLLVFDRAIGDRPASLWAVVLGVDDRGVIEMVYAGGGVIRRGFVDPARPRVARDKKTRAVHNTFLRHAKDWPPKGTRFLAGELLADTYRLR